MPRFLSVRRSLAGFAALIFLCAVTTEARGSTISKTLIALGYEEIALRRTDENRLFIFARVNGRKRSCLIDSGWSFTSISTNTAGKLTVSNVLERLELGRVTITNLAARVQDIRVNGQPASFDIVLGCDFLLANNAVLDIAGNRLFLRRDQPAETDRARIGERLAATKRAAFALNIRQPPAPTIVARVNGRDMELLVDSGATWSCLDADVAQRAGLRSSPSARQMSGVVGTEKRPFNVAVIDDVRISDARLAGANFAVLSLTDWGFGPAGGLFPDVSGIFGGAELLANQAVMDFGGRQLWLRTKGETAH